MSVDEARLSLTTGAALLFELLVGRGAPLVFKLTHGKLTIVVSSNAGSGLLVLSHDGMRFGLLVAGSKVLI
jgi:hypothetical protein